MTCQSDADLSELRSRMPASARRSQLLDVALECFAAGGYRDTSMEQIAARAGVTKPVLYQHFHSKEQLFQELLDSVSADLIEDIATRARAETDPYQRVRAGFKAYFELVCKRTAAFNLILGSGGRVADQLATAIAGLISVDADVDADHDGLLAHGIVGLAESGARHWVTRRSGNELDIDEADRIATRLADLLWDGLRSLPGEPRGCAPR